MTYLSILIFAMFATLALISVFRRYAVQMHCIDLPSERKMHDHPVPRVGGIAMAVGVLIPVLLWVVKDQAAVAILMGGTIIVLMGVVDDIKELGYRTKFTGQILAGLVAMVMGGLNIRDLFGLLPAHWMLPGWLSPALTLLVILAVTNAVNLADGLDGLAGGIMLMSFVGIGFVAHQQRHQDIAQLAAATVGAIFGFLRFNSHPARVFMGDAGSQLLGFLAATMLIAISQGHSSFGPLLPLLLLGLPLIDTGMVVVERVAKGMSPFKADKNHLHHKLLRLNLFHREAVLVIYLLQAGMVTAAFLLRFATQWYALVIYLLFCFGIIISLNALLKKGWHFDRPGVFDRWVKSRLRVHIKESALMIRLSQAVIENGFLLVLLAASMMPSGLPAYTGLIALCLAVALPLADLKSIWLGNQVLRVLIYFFLPLLLYYGQQHPYEWIPLKVIHLFDLSFGGLVLFALLALKTTRREMGYEASPLHFLIIFIALVAPNVPEAGILKSSVGFAATKIMVLFFVFEVLVGELRGDLRRLKQCAVGGLLLVSLRCVL